MIPSQRDELPEDLDAFWDSLYQEYYSALCRYAQAILIRYGHRDNLQHRAEDIVQEALLAAWERREAFLIKENRLAWLFRAVNFKAKEDERKNRDWVKRILKLEGTLSRNEMSEDFRLRYELEGMVSEDDFTLLRELYIERRSYEELCAKYGLKKSALAMKIKRIKERFIKAYDQE